MFRSSAVLVNQAPMCDYFCLLMNGLVFSNFLHRPARTVVSILGIAIGVLLIVFTVGLAEGSIRERAYREGNVNAEIFFHPKGAMNLMGSEFRLDLAILKDVKAIEGVADVVPIGQVTATVTDNRTGQRRIGGVNFEEYKRLVDIDVVTGRVMKEGADEVIIDTAFQRQKKIKIGDKMELWERDFVVVGAYEPAAGARVKTSLPVVQDQVGTDKYVSAFLVKIKENATENQVGEALSKKFPDHQILLTSQLEDIYMTSVPALGTFLDIVIGIAAVISALVILMTMYTTVTERTRQIGVMKSLGMANLGIAWVITKESILISSAGVLTGIVLSFALRWVLSFVTVLEIGFDIKIFLIVSFVGVIGGALGGLYPALRAARMDAVDALSYE